MANSPLDSYWINLDEIRLWMHTCDTKHTCWAADTQTAVAWLIDVHRKCLIPCDPNTNYQYVALSYVWGQCPSSHTTMANLDAFQIPGVFSEKNPDVTIPKTIRHAIKLVGLLNIRYLWVDRFCICQDDAVSMHQQLWQMAYIYERAYLTLIAANGRDADHGLHGIKGVTKQRKLLASCEFKWTYWGELSHLASKWVCLYISTSQFRSIGKQSSVLIYNSIREAGRFKNYSFHVANSNFSLTSSCGSALARFGTSQQG